MERKTRKTISLENWLIIENHVGAEEPNFEAIKVFYQDHGNHFHEQVENMYGDTLIHLAAGAGKCSLVKNIISFSRNKGREENLVDVQNKFGFTPLHSALNSCQTAVAKLLIELGANVRLEDYSKATALHIAAEKNNVDVINKLLTEIGSKNLFGYLNQRDYNNDTPLHYAAKHDSVDALRYLISRGADFRKENLDKRTPILVAQNCENMQCFDALMAAGSTPKGFNEKLFKDIVFNLTKKASNNEEERLIELLFSYLQLMLKCNLLKKNIQMDPGDETIRSRYDEIKSKLQCDSDSELFEKFKEKLDDLAVKNDISKCSIVAQSILKEFMDEVRCKFCREKAKENRTDEIKFCHSLDIQFHECAVQKSWKLFWFLTQIPKALVSETFDSVSDLVTAFENYGGQSKNFGLYEILNWFVMQVIESLLSAYTLFEEEKQQLEAQRGVKVCKKDVKSLNYHGIWWVHYFWLMFWPFRILRADQDTKKSNGFDNVNESNITRHNTPKTFKKTYLIYIYNILSAIVLPRSYGDKVLEYMHEPTTLWEIQHLKLRRRWLKQIPFILGKIPEFVIQFYTIQVLFNADEKYQSISFGQFFTDYNFLLRILSMISICYRMPKSVVSLENNIRASDPVAQEMKADCSILQMAHSIMLLARISLISTLLISVTVTQFGLYVGIRVACDWILNIGSCYYQDQYYQSRRFVGKVFLSIILIFLSIRDFVLISPRSPGAYLSNKPRESYVSLRDQKNLSIRGMIFLLEGYYAARIIYFQYPHGGLSYVFRHTGWVSVALIYISLLLLISSAELLHPLKGHKTALRKNLFKSAFLYLGSLFCCCCMPFLHYKYMDMEIKDSLWALILFLVASLVCHCSLLFYTIWKAFKKKDATKSDQDKLCSNFSICKFKSMFGKEKRGSKHGIPTEVSQRTSQNRSSSLRSELKNRFSSHQYHPVRFQDRLSNEPAPVTTEADSSVTTEVDPCVTTEVDPSVTTDVDPPVTTEADPPVTKKADPPVTTEVDPSVATEADPSVTTEADPPVTTKVDPPVTKKADPSVATEVDPSVTTEVYPAVTTEADPPVTTEVDPSVTTEADPPVTKKADPAVTTEVDPPVTTEVDPPVTTEVDPAVTTEADPPVTTEVDPSVTTEADPPVTAE